MIPIPYRFYPQVENINGDKNELDIILEAVANQFSPRDITFDGATAIFSENFHDVPIKLGYQLVCCNDVNQWSRTICNLYKTVNVKKDKYSHIWMPHNRANMNLVLYIIHNNVMMRRQKEFDEIFDLPSLFSHVSATLWFTMSVGLSVCLSVGRSEITLLFSAFLCF